MQQNSERGMKMFFYDSSQELSPTTDSNLVTSLMNLIDCQLDEFHDEAKVAQLEEREIITWLEVNR